MQINRRKVLQGLQATGAESSMHMAAVNTLPAILVAITVDGEYRFEEDLVREAMQTHVSPPDRSDAYVQDVTRTLVWLNENGHLPEPVEVFIEASPEGSETGADEETETDDEPESSEEPETVVEPEPVEEVEEEPKAARKSRATNKSKKSKK